MKGPRARALFVASWALCGCNVLVGLDDVNIVQAGPGGATAANGGTDANGAGSPEGGAGATAPTGGDTPGATSTGSGGATTGPAGGGGTSTSSAGGGGGTSTSSTGGGDTSTSSTGGGGGGDTSSTGGTGGAPPGSTCGDGFIADGEQCDDGNGSAGDGCSDTCQVEPFHQCTAPGPSACSGQEILCADGADGDGDGLVDILDPDCILPEYTPSIACNDLRIFRSVNAPLALPDKNGGKAQSPIVVPDALSIGHTAVLVDVSHPLAVDLQVTLIPPFGQPRILTSDNGNGGGADYTETLFDGACFQSVTAGSPPFQGCYKPESFLPSSGQEAQGVWTLELEDHVTGTTGTLDGWTLILCAQ